MQGADDGRGIDISLAIEEAVERGIVSPEAATNLDDEHALRFLFRPGFTTRDETTELSGRGIGLDAVAATVRSVGGDLWISSSVGEGTEVTVEVPLARRGERVLVVASGEHQIAVPASPIRAFRRVTADLLEGADGSISAQVGGRSVDTRLVADLLGEKPGDAGVMLEMHVGGSNIFLVVDAVLGEEEVIVRPMPPGVGAPACMGGMTLLASGRPVPVLSLESLRPFERMARRECADRPVSKLKASHVLLVDDSRVSREMVGRSLEDAGFAVTGVKSAEDQSPIGAVDRVSTPTLVIHSETDWRTPIEQGQRWFTALRLRGVPTELLIFPAESHELSRSGRPRHRRQRFEHILRWWGRHLPLEAPA
ncbi:MAG: prolyl oligopeptidase family serine peptidase [Acidobacteriota bacterium]